MRRLLPILRWGFILLAVLAVIGGACLTAGYLWLAPTIPPVDALRQVDYQVPMRVHTQDGELIAEFGERRRIRVTREEVPDQMVHAFIAAEDERFYEHPGVDYQGILRAVWHLIRTGEKGPGGSTITMQVARNFYLSREATYKRKAREILLALKIEREISKEAILELYFNKIYLGQRAYGVGAAAQAYYGRDVSELNLAQVAMIAGLPKAPSALNPLSNPKRALERRAYVLSRMLEEGYIDEAAYQRANKAPITAKRQHARGEVEAPYIAEEARQAMVERYGKDEAYTRGLDVYTSIEAASQRRAIEALRANLHAYDERHGWRGPVASVDADALGDAALRRELGRYPAPGPLVNGVVLGVDGEGAELLLADEADPVRLPFAGMAWAREFISRSRRGAEPKGPGDVVSKGDIVRVRETDDGLRLAQIPEPQSALISLDPRDGRIRAMVGGYAFEQSKYNRALQAERQPGSSFKPLVYSAALANGFTPATIVNDAPVVFQDRALEATWRPQNYSEHFFGPTRLRQGLIHSRNLVSIRVLRRIGIEPARDFIERFGFPPSSLPENLSLALGSGAVTPMQMARGYSVFANGGFRIEPWLIERVVDDDGQVLVEAQPVRACEGMICDEAANDAAASDDEPGAGTGPSGADGAEPNRAERVIPAANAWLMTDMMRDVIQHGTGRRARELGRSDLAGKTGTTNKQKDAWFAGFNHAVATAVWVGFDQIEPMGPRETGSQAALPLWKDFMAHELDGIPEKSLVQPAGIVTVRIDSDSGKLTGPGNPNAIFEHFRRGNVPPREADSDTPEDYEDAGDDNGGEGSESAGSQPVF